MNPAVHQVGANSPVSTPPRPSLFTVTGVAFEMGVSTATVWRWHAEDPTFPRALKLGENCTRWHRAEIEAWIASKPIATTVEA